MTGPSNLLAKPQLFGITSEILAQKPETMITNDWSIEVDRDPGVVLAAARALAIGSLLLKDGADLSSPDVSDYHPAIGLAVDRTHLEIVSVSASGQEQQSGDKDDLVWSARGLFLKFRFADPKNPRNKAIMSLGVYADSEEISPSAMMQAHRDVWASLYSEQGYDGHNRSARDFHQPSIMQFIWFVRGLIDLPKVGEANREV